MIGDTEQRNTPGGKHTELRPHQAETHQAERHTKRRRATEIEKRDRWKTRLGPEREGEQQTLFQVLPEGRVATTGLIYDVVRHYKRKECAKGAQYKLGDRETSRSRRCMKQMWEHHYINGKQQARLRLGNVETKRKERISEAEIAEEQ